MYVNPDVQDQLWQEVISLLYSNNFKINQIKKILKEKYEIIRKPELPSTQKQLTQ